MGCQGCITPRTENQRSRTRKAHYEPLVLSVMRTTSDHSMLLNCNLAFPYPGIGDP